MGVKYFDSNSGKTIKQFKSQFSLSVIIGFVQEEQQRPLLFSLITLTFMQLEFVANRAYHSLITLSVSYELFIM